MIDWSDTVLRIGAATAMGGIIGLNRNLHGKPSGLRTLALVGLGAATMVLVATGEGADPAAVSRVLQGLLTGVGFLGAGVILHEAKDQKVHGMTTAATIWVTACLGAACGAGALRTAFTAFAFVAAVLLFGGPLEKAVRRILDQRSGPRDDGHA